MRAFHNPVVKKLMFGSAIALAVEAMHPLRGLGKPISFMATGNSDTLHNANSFVLGTVGGASVADVLGMNPQFLGIQTGVSQLSHENLAARYGGPNPNQDAAIFENNYNDQGIYNGPTVSSGVASSAMNTSPPGSLVFGLYNRRLQ